VSEGDHKDPDVSGEVLHWDGKTVHPYILPLRPHAIWGTAPDNVYVAGEFGVARWDGRDLTIVDKDDPMRGISGTGPDDVWAVGDGWAHFDGKRWKSVLSSYDLNAAWRDWAVGKAGLIVHKMRPVPSPTDQNILAIAGTGPDDLWIAAENDHHDDVFHFDGKTWTRSTSINWDGDEEDGNSISSISALAPDDVWVAGPRDGLYHFDGSSWTPRGNIVHDISPSFRAVAGVATDLFVSTDEGDLLRGVIN
jgi:hypothetical protein